MSKLFYILSRSVVIFVGSREAHILDRRTNSITHVYSPLHVSAQFGLVDINFVLHFSLVMSVIKRDSMLVGYRHQPFARKPCFSHISNSCDSLNKISHSVTTGRQTQEILTRRYQLPDMQQHKKSSTHIAAYQRPLSGSFPQISASKINIRTMQQQTSGDRSRARVWTIPQLGGTSRVLLHCGGDDAPLTSMSRIRQLPRLPVAGLYFWCAISIAYSFQILSTIIWIFHDSFGLGVVSQRFWQSSCWLICVPDDNSCDIYLMMLWDGLCDVDKYLTAMLWNSLLQT